jgi:hypothetical protein
MKTRFFLVWVPFALIIVSNVVSGQTKVSDLFDICKLPYFKDSKLIQISSNDTSGGNADYVTVKKDQTAVLADIKGAGVISRIWVTISSPDKYFLRRILLRMYWDGEENPSVEVPVGDFFGTGFQYTHYLSALVGMSSGGYYSYFPMPFSKGARIEAVNHTGQDVGSFYYHIDYQELKELEPNIGRFHAQWRREPRTEKGKPYTVLEAEGRGQFVGLNLNMQGYREKQLWFLEGDEFIYVDGETLASIRGTGTEDYFTSGWYFNKGTYAGPYHGLIIKDDTLQSRIAAYRFHIGDQIPFQKSIKVTIEHGHANAEPGDYSSVAYWYQTEPHKTFSSILPPERRIPLRVVVPENAIEAEDLLGTSTVVGGELAVTNMSSYGVDWGHDKQLEFRTSSARSEFSLSLPIRYPDRYTLYAYLSKGPTYGALVISSEGKTLLEFDGYGREFEPAGKVTLGHIAAMDSVKHVECRVTGKAEESTGYDVGIDAFVLVPDRVFMQDWYVIGPFDNPRGAKDTTVGLGIAYGPEEGIDLSREYPGKRGKPISWRIHHADTQGFVNFAHLFSPSEFTVAYAMSYVLAPEARDVPLFLGSDDGAKIWLNDRLVHERWIKRGPSPDQDTVMVHLQKGWNKVLIKVEQGQGAWGLYCRIPNPRGDLVFSAEPKQGR